MLSWYYRVNTANSTPNSLKRGRGVDGVRGPPEGMPFTAERKQLYIYDYCAKKEKESEVVGGLTVFLSDFFVLHIFGPNSPNSLPAKTSPPPLNSPAGRA
eukprot:COSAG02_NODE_5182_length_4563_cov_4.094982_2_plen_100_part_00